MRGTVSAYVLAILILALGQDGSAEKPQISPWGDSPIQMKGYMRIRCKSRGEVNFSVQKLTGKATHSSFISSFDNGTGDHMFVFANLKAADTGWYACAEKGVEIRNDEQTTEHPDNNISWTYVYVKSSEPFAVMDASENIPVVAGRSVVIPCRPTSPDLEVRLEIINPTKRLPPENKYDPRIGFTIRQANLTYNDNIFSCKVNGSEEVVSPTYTLKVTVPETPRKPEITQGTLFHTILGENLVIECRTDAPKGDDITLYWKLPPAVEGSTSTLQKRITIEKEHEVVNHDLSPRMIWKSKLTVRKAERSDRGGYTCVAKGFVEESSSSIEIQIWEPGNMTGGNATRVNLGQPAVLSCSVDGYSLSNFTWPDIDTSEGGERSKTTERHSVSSTASVMYLNFTSVTRGDNGTYECGATDYNGTLSNQTSLIVTEVPEVTIDLVMSEGNDTVYLHWTLYGGNEPLTAYRIQQREQGTEEWENCSGKINETLFSYVAEKLESNTTYEFRIIAENAIGVSNTSYSGMIRTLERDVDIEFVAEVTVKRLSDTKIKVFWTSPEGVIRDRFHYYQLLAKYGNDIRKAIDIPLHVTTYVFHDLRNGSEYIVELQACNKYTGKCVTSHPPKTRGIGYTIAVYSGFILAFPMFIIIGILIYRRKRRQRAWEKDCHLADLKSRND